MDHTPFQPPGTFGLLPYFLVVALLGWTATAAWLGWAFRRLEQERQERKRLLATLEDCLEQSRKLSNLREQLNSHFLFNALNTIRYFVRIDTQMARGLLLDLSEYLKGAVDTNEMGTLGEELDRGVSYLNLEQARLGERLELRVSIDEAPGGRAFPTRVLQPLFGILLKRGANHEGAPWWISVSCTVRGSSAVLTLSDNAPDPLDPSALAPLSQRLLRGCPGSTIEFAQHEITLTLP